jgi:hypothetical protein
MQSSKLPSISLPSQPSPPFTHKHQLNNELNDLNSYQLEDQNEKTLSLPLPDYPRISLGDFSGIQYTLERDLLAPDLEKMAPHLWLLSTQSSSNVSPLHHQAVKGRKIIITEDPRLHLVWIYDRIFLKPVPAYLLSYNFWTQYLLNTASPLPEPTRTELCKSALGFLRTYKYLIKHRSDHRIAIDKELELLPAKTSFTSLSNFISDLESITDSNVSKRYHYGEIRLTRLNFYGKFILRRWHFHTVHGQYGAYFKRFYGPLLFVFTIMSLILNSMQVELAVEAMLNSGQWTGFWSLCRYFCVLTLVAIFCVGGAMFSVLMWMIVDEWIYAIRDRRAKRRSGTAVVKEKV